jgi:hypothetical protein
LILLWYLFFLFAGVLRHALERPNGILSKKALAVPIVLKNYVACLRSTNR